MTELRNLQATGLTTIGQSLRTAFDLLNLNRLVTGIDNYGQVCSTEEAEKKSGLESVATRWNVSPHTPFTPLLPFPYPQSYKHQPPAHCDPHTQSCARDTNITATKLKKKDEEQLYFINSVTLIDITSDFVTTYCHYARNQMYSV